MTPFNTGTLAGAGSFKCETCGFAVALHRQDQIPDCPSCGGSSFKRSSMFGGAPSHASPRLDGESPDWLDAARESLSRTGHYLAYDTGDRTVAIPLADGWTRVGRSLTAEVRLDDPTVSRRHALVHTDGSDAKVLDDRSLNGVFRNGSRVELSELEDGDTLTVGRFNLHFIAFDGEVARRTEETAGSRS